MRILYILTLLVSFHFALSKSELEFLKENLLEKMKLKGDEPVNPKKEEFVAFINALLGTDLGDDVLKCRYSYEPEANSHEIFIAQYQKVSAAVNAVINQQVPKEITGQKCIYNLSDPNVFTSAKKTELAVQPLLISFIYKTAFGRTFVDYIKCIGIDELTKMTDPDFIAEMFFEFGNEKNTIRLFESFCSINNILNRFKTIFDYKDKSTFTKLGAALHDVLVDVKMHYFALKEFKDN